MTGKRAAFGPRHQDRLIAALDIGASKTACMIARVAPHEGYAPQVEILGVGHHGGPIRPREAASAEQIEKGVRHAVEAAERMAGERVRRVAVAVDGRYLRTRRIGVDIEIAGGQITAEDIDDSLAEGAAIAAAQDHAALHAIATAFKADGEEIVTDPVGMNASVLSSDMLGVAARQSILDNFSSLLERCGLDVDEFIAGPFAAGEATLIDDEKDLGVVLIDIGAASTSYAVYDDGVMIDCGGVGVGGGHISKDIAQIFGAPLAAAERLKILHGAALLGPGDEHRFVDYPEIGAASELARASRADLCDVIIPRVEEIFELVADRLPEDRMRRIGLRRVVITGGGSLLIGAREVAERVLSMKCRIGKPAALAGAPEAAGAPGFAVCAGLIQNIVNCDQDWRSGLGVSRQSVHPLTQASLFNGVQAWLREKF
ncbi:MAG: cell division protein FtsA [Hyphococcus sp.]